MSNPYEPKKPAKASPKRESNIRFINHNFTPEERRRIETLDVLNECPFSLALVTVETGYRFTLSYNERNKCYTASFTDNRPDSMDFNRCLSGRGSTATDAWISLAARHFILADGDWSYFEDNPSGNRGDGFW